MTWLHNTQNSSFLLATHTTNFAQSSQLHIHNFAQFQTHKTNLNSTIPNNKNNMTFINRAAKQCDYCTLAPAILYCRNDAAFMCMACDARVHVGTAGAKHARVLTCEVCEQAPAAVTCKADAASLCVICDRDIHAANPLASRHQRVPVVPFFETAETLVMKSADVVVDAADVFPPPILDDVANFETWGFSDMNTTAGDVTVPSKFIGPVEMKSLDCLLADSEALFGIDGFDGFGSFADSVVPVQNSETSNQFNDYSAETGFEIDFAKPNISSYNSYTTKPCISVSSSSIDVCVVPDTTAFSDISLPYMKNPIVITDPNQGSQVIGMDREARVMRYREKKKNRKFEKTVRYASRKAYAETRPRVKGRFAKKTDMMSEMDQMFGDGSFHFDIDDKFGVVPSF